MNTIYFPMIVDKNGQKYLCMGDIDSYYINPTDKELEKIKEILNTAYYSLSDAEKRNYTYKMFKFTTDKEPSNINDEWLAHQTYEDIEYYLDYDKYSFITTKNSAVNDFTNEYRKETKMLSEWEKNAQRARRLYPEGTRIELINMNDPYHPVEEGMRGTVDIIDDAGQIFMNWDNGYGLAIVPGVDEFRKLTPEEIEKENMSQQYVNEVIKFHSEGDNSKAYESWSKLFDLYNTSPEASDNERMADSKQLSKYLSKIDDKTVFDVTDYGREQHYREKGYYNEIQNDDLDICD